MKFPEEVSESCNMQISNISISHFNLFIDANEMNINWWF